MTTTQARGAETRNTILEAALDLFSQNGYDTTSVAEICQNAQISKGAFYHHFASKQDLFLALMDTWIDFVADMFQSAGETAQSVPDALNQMASIAGGLLETMEGGFPILLEFWTQASRHPAIWEKAIAPYRRFLDYFTDLIQTGIDEGQFVSTLNPEQAARTIISIAMGLLLQAIFNPKDAQWQQVINLSITMLINSMRSEK